MAHLPAWPALAPPSVSHPRCYCCHAGGTLPPDVEEYANKESIQKSKLQTLKNHQKVKKWTKVSGRVGR